MDFLAKKWGFIQEKPQNMTFQTTWGSIQEWGCIQANTVIQMCHAPIRCIGYKILSKNNIFRLLNFVNTDKFSDKSIVSNIANV